MLGRGEARTLYLGVLEEKVHDHKDEGEGQEEEVEHAKDNKAALERASVAKKRLAQSKVAGEHVVQQGQVQVPLYTLCKGQLALAARKLGGSWERGCGG